MGTSEDTQVTQDLVAFCVSKQVSLRNSQPSAARTLIFVNLPPPKGTAIVWANLDPLSLFIFECSLADNLYFCVYWRFTWKGEVENGE